MCALVADGNKSSFDGKRDGGGHTGPPLRCAGLPTRNPRGAKVSPGGAGAPAHADLRNQSLVTCFTVPLSRLGRGKAKPGEFFERLNNFVTLFHSLLRNRESRCHLWKSSALGSAVRTAFRLDRDTVGRASQGAAGTRVREGSRILGPAQKQLGTLNSSSSPSLHAG